MFFNIFDLSVFTIILVSNLYLKKINIILFLVIFFLLFALLFPYLSVKVDISQIPSDVEVDGFNFAYIKVKWLFYWVVGLLEVCFFVGYKFPRNSRNKNK